MIVLNKKMRFNLLKNKKQISSIDNQLDAILVNGFVSKDECYFISSLIANQNHIKEDDFQDKTGFECFINSIHIDDYVESDYLMNSILLSDKLIDLWSSMKTDLILKVIIGETDFGYNLRFHVVRYNENWIDENSIENFEEGIMICTS